MISLYFVAKAYLHWMGDEGWENLHLMLDTHTLDCDTQGDEDGIYEIAQQLATQAEGREMQDGDLLVVLLAGRIIYTQTTDHEGTPDGSSEVDVQWSTVTRPQGQELKSLELELMDLGVMAQEGDE